jgi:hypothetical protein
MLLAASTLAVAQQPAALVESVHGQVKGAEFMDYVAPGHVIKLGAGGSIVLAYLSTCVRETVTGGEVVVGTAESSVSQGDVSREKQTCDLPRAQLPASAETGSGTAFRNTPRKQQPQRVTLYGLSPMIEVEGLSAAGSGKLVIERTDKPGEHYEAMLSKTTLVKGRFYDLARAGTQLKPGGVYLATLGERKALFKIDPLAAAEAPLLGRLLRL